MEFGVCETYGKASLFSKFLSLFTRKAWFEYSTIQHPLDWKEV